MFLNGNLEFVSSVLIGYLEVVSSAMIGYLEVVSSFMIGYLEVVWLLFLLDPVESLLLWIDTEREARGARGQYAVLDGQFIRRQALRRPPKSW